VGPRPVQSGDQHPDDEVLVARARSGDQDAFGTLMARHRDGVFTMALRLVGERETAADVTQEAFLRAWRGLARFRGEARFTTWLYRITVNTASNHRARVARHRAASLDETAGVADPDAPSPEDAAERVGVRRDLLAALAALPMRQRTVVVLKDVYGWTHQEIAGALGISVTAAKVRLHRARARLRDHLGGERP
jgi:RNA polymerase sigma-70 factor, ECF subfamily